MEISASLVKELREKTGISIRECQQALKETNGDMTKAVEYLRKKGEQMVAKKECRTTKAGIVGSYIHQDSKQAALVKLLCETDFVAKNEEFVSLAHNIAMQIVALRPKWTQPSQIPAEIMEKEKEIYESEVDAKKPKEIKEKIINGKLEKFYVQNCLLKQPYIKDDSQTIEQLIAALVGKLGEKIELKEFVLFSI